MINFRTYVLFFISSVIGPFYSFTFAFANYGNEVVIGKLESSSEGYYQLRTSEGELKVSIPHQYHSELGSLTGEYLSSFAEFDNSLENAQDFYDYYTVFKGKRDGKIFFAQATPQLRSGDVSLRGKLTYVKGEYYLGDQVVVFSKAGKVNNTSFDQKSIDYFVNREVEALAKRSGDSINITSLVLSDVFSARNVEWPTAKGAQDRVAQKITSKIMSSNGGNGFLESFSEYREVALSDMSHARTDDKINDYVLNLFYEDKVAENHLSVREVLYQKENSPVQPGDQALIITLSGSQGDDPSALGGHIGFGSATVRSDLSLDGEISNFYNMPNKKKIVSGYTNIVDYFGHITAGQNNYRPTYNLIFYGVPNKVLKAIRDEVGKDYHDLRNKSDKWGPFYNCTTVAVDALKSVGIVGKKDRDIVESTVLGLGSILFSMLNTIYPDFIHLFVEKEERVDMNKIIFTMLEEDPNRFLPRVAFDGLVKRIPRIIKKYNLKRVDYVLLAQTPSERLIGGAPSRSVMAIAKGTEIMRDRPRTEYNWSDREVGEVITELMR